MSDILMTDLPDYEIRIKGHPLIRIGKSGVDVTGKDFHKDLKDISTIRDILSDILGEAKTASRPRLVSVSSKVKQ